MTSAQVVEKQHASKSRRDSDAGGDGGQDASPAPATDDSASIQGIAPQGRQRSHAIDYGTSGITAPLAVTKNPVGAGPSIDDIAIPGVDKSTETSDPYAAIVGYEKYTGGLLKSTQRHDQKIETYGRFVETDHRRLARLFSEFNAIGEIKDPEKQAKRRDELIDKVGGKKLPEEQRAYVWAGAFEIAEERSRLAAVARADADTDVPMVDAVYERTRDAKKKLAKSDKKTPSASTASAAVGLGRAVREAKLSEGRLFVKTSELEHHKKSIEDAVSTGDWWKAKAKFVGKKILGAGVGVATAGIVGIEDAGIENDKALGVNTTTIWGRLSKQLAQIDEISKKRPYGSATSFHMALEAYATILGEMRNVVAGIGTLLGLAAIPLALVAPPVAAVLKIAAVIAGLVALGLTAFKVAIGAVLTTWSLIQRLASSNARKHQVQEGQLRNQAAVLLSDSASAAMSFAGPALGNAGALGTHGNTHFHNPLEQLKTGVSSTTTSAASGLTWANVGQMAATTGTGTASGIGTAVLGETVVKDEMTTEMASHRMTPRGAVPASHQAKQPGGPRRPLQEPDWIKKARASEQETLDESVDQLVKTHQAKMGTFHDRTQTLMGHTKKLDSDSDAATTKLDAVAKEKSPKKQEAAQTAGSTDRSGIALAKALGAEMNSVLTQLDKHGKSLSPAEVRELVAGSRP